MAVEQPLLEVRNLTKYYSLQRSFLEKILTRKPDILVKAVDQVDLKINKGETLGLVGESGCGKSSLGRAILRLHEPTGGEVHFAGQNVISLQGQALREYRKQAQIIFQNPYASLNPRKTIRQILTAALKQRGINGSGEQEDRIRALLDKVGLSGRFIDRYPHQFSGGQRQRVGIARALAMEPQFIVADEPVSALDVSVQAQIINLLEELKDELGLTYLFVAHDLSVVYYVSDRVAVMYLGKVVEIGETEELFRNPLHPYTLALLSAIPSVDLGARRKRILLEGTVPTPIDPPEGCRFQTRCFMKKGTICEEQQPVLRECGAGHAVACHLFR